MDKAKFGCLVVSSDGMHGSHPCGKTVNTKQITRNPFSNGAVHHKPLKVGY